MNNRDLPGKLILAGACGCLLLAILGPSFARAQSSETAADWEKAAGGKTSFEVASVKPNDFEPYSPSVSNFLPGPESGHHEPPNGVLSATNYRVGPWIAFAYKLDPSGYPRLEKQLPKWTTHEAFDLEARPSVSNPTWDQVRLMMQSLLADRFKLAVHFDTKESPAYALVLAKAGKLGSQMRRYPDGFPCSETLPPQIGGRGRDPNGPAPIMPAVDDGRFPAYCGGISRMNPREGGLRWGGRNVSIESIVAWIDDMGGLDRPLVDRTSLDGAFDISVEFGAPRTAGNGLAPPPSGTALFLEAVNDQLGLKLQSITAPVQSLIIDHIEEPTPN
jgi:uncharacterized protein (TIGR03435 family)